MQLAQMLIPVAAAFSLVVMAMPLFIGYMRFKKEGQMIREDGPKWHAQKSGTPTMGGVVFLLAIVVATIGTAWWQHQLDVTIWVALFVLGLYGLLGFVDDYVKVVNRRNLGLRAWQKLLGQILGALVFVLCYRQDGFELTLRVPFIGEVTSVWLFLGFAVVWLVGFSNAVNLSDGLDGLVGGLSTIAFLTYAVVAAHDNRVDVLIVCLVTVGAMLGFLVFNHKPAQIFMGDSGSLALGGLLAVVAIMLHREWSLLLVGLVFVVETASVMLQVAVFKTIGRRVFKMSPIHHHFELSGWSEWRVDLTFWAVGLGAALVYLALFL